MHLYIFDFDDTLCVSDSEVRLTDKETGQEMWMNSRDFRTHQFDKSRYDYDTSQFGTLPDNHIPVDHVLQVAKKAYRSGGPDSLMILTARDNPAGPQEFLDLYGLSGVEVVALGDASNVGLGKAEWLKSEIDQRGLTSISYYEDSQHHINGFRKLAQLRPDVKFNIYKIDA
jgi:hypothetical protein